MKLICILSVLYTIIILITFYTYYLTKFIKNMYLNILKKSINLQFFSKLYKNN
jgi:hypothetical protein